MSSWLYRHRVVSTVVVLWALGVVTYATLRVFGVVTEVNAAVVSAYTALLGIPAAAFGLWQWRAKDANDDGRPD